MASQTTGSLAELFLGRVLSIKKREYVAVAWSFGYFFCVLSSYYMLRPVREAMAISSGPNTIPFLFMGTFTVMLAVTPVFGWVASRFPRRVFLPWVYLFFISNILIFWGVFTVAIERGESFIWLGRIFFVWISVFNLFVVSVFWSFMADIYTREQGRRLFGVITSGGSIGALAGGAVTSLFVTQVGFQNLFPISAALLFIAVLCIRKLRNWAAVDHQRRPDDSIEGEKPLGGNPFAGVTHLFGSKYFGGIAISSVIANLLGTALYMFTAQLVEQAILEPDSRTQFFSNLNNIQNALALIAQLLIVKRVVARFGIGVSLALMPALSVAGFLLLALEPTLAVVAIFTVVRRAIGFGFAKPTTDMLYSVVTPEEKYKTKNFIDTVVYRGGDLIGTWSIRGMTALGMGLSAIAWMLVPFAALWAMVAMWLGRDYRRRARELRDSGLQ